MIDTPEVIANKLSMFTAVRQSVVESITIDPTRFFHLAAEFFLAGKEIDEYNKEEMLYDLNSWLYDLTVGVPYEAEAWPAPDGFEIKVTEVE